LFGKGKGNGIKQPPYSGTRINTYFLGFIIALMGTEKMINNHKKCHDKEINPPLEFFYGPFQRGMVWGWCGTGVLRVER